MTVVFLGKGLSGWSGRGWAWLPAMAMKAQRAKQAVNQVEAQEPNHRRGCRMVRTLGQATRLEPCAQAPVEWLRGAAVAGAVQVLGAVQDPNPKGPEHPIAMPALRRSAPPKGPPSISTLSSVQSDERSYADFGAVDLLHAMRGL